MKRNLHIFKRCGQLFLNGKSSTPENAISSTESNCITCSINIEMPPSVSESLDLRLHIAEVGLK